MFERLFRSMERRAQTCVPETKSTPPWIALQLIGGPRWSSRDYASLARNGVMKNAVVYRCVRMIAEAAASVPFLLYEGETELEQHPLLALLRSPNARESGATLFERWYAFLQCAGNSYLQALTIQGEVRELHVLRPDRVKAIESAGGWPLAYEYCVNGRSARIGRDASGFLPLLHGSLFHPLDDHYGLSPIEPALNAIDVHNQGASWTKALLDNAARPSGALVYKGPDGAPNLTDDQFRRLKDELETGYQGAINAGRPMVLEGGLEWQSMSHSPADLDFANTRDVAAREIALAFGVPPMLLGIPGDNTYSNYAQANLALWRQTVLPLVARTAAQLTRWLKPKFGEALRIDYDIDAVPALSEAREATWEKLTGASFLTLNEKRAAAGYGPLDDGDTME
ncbi:MAG: phage portal protein [Alphaproteobacteria bacterium]|nr:phage portal protein [Alphaproteobacteria bacterium]